MLVPCVLQGPLYLVRPTHNNTGVLAGCSVEGLGVPVAKPQVLADDRDAGAEAVPAATSQAASTWNTQETGASAASS